MEVQKIFDVNFDCKVNVIKSGYRFQNETLFLHSLNYNFRRNSDSYTISHQDEQMSFVHLLMNLKLFLLNCRNLELKHFLVK